MCQCLSQTTKKNLIVFPKNNKKTKITLIFFWIRQKCLYKFGKKTKNKKNDFYLKETGNYKKQIFRKQNKRKKKERKTSFLWN